MQNYSRDSVNFYLSNMFTGIVKDNLYMNKQYVICLWGFHKQSKEDGKEKLQHCVKITTLFKTKKEMNIVLLILLYFLIEHYFSTLQYIYFSLNIVFTAIFPVPSKVSAWSLLSNCQLFQSVYKVIVNITSEDLLYNEHFGEKGIGNF